MTFMINIGVSASFIYPDPARPYFAKKTLACLESDMARYLSRPGVILVLIPKLGEEFLQDYVGELDGLVFQGGSDIAPQSYGEMPIDPVRWPGDAQRDRYELALMKLAVARKIPVLGICRGCQLINVYFGGTLYQDLHTQVEGVGAHRDAERYDGLHHSVEFKSGGVLDRLYAQASVRRINSVHHQGIKDVGKGLKVDAVSPDDGLVEAVVHQDFDVTPVFGIQWHPEFSATLADKVLPADPLYTFFLEKVKTCKS